MLIIDLPTCVYCGNEATTVDHVFPLSSGLPTYEVPACFECNCNAGPKLFETFDKKANYLLDKARMKGRVRWQTLAWNAPLVIEAIARHAAGKSSVPNVAEYELFEKHKSRNCAYCEAKFFPKTPSNKYCGGRCTSVVSRNRRRNLALHPTLRD